MHNCDLVNLDDMLQNGTVISGTLIEKPHSFSTACNIATQIIAQVASNQYGGQSISLTHLAPPQKDPPRYRSGDEGTGH
jgi:anaerobic ribonucleoside-triphosphate reductase